MGAGSGVHGDVCGGEHVVEHRVGTCDGARGGNMGWEHVRDHMMEHVVGCVVLGTHGGARGGDMYWRAWWSKAAHFTGFHSHKGIAWFSDSSP